MEDKVTQSNKPSQSSQLAPIEPDEELYEEQPESIVDVLTPLVPLAKTYLENKNREVEAQVQLQSQQLEVTKMQGQQEFSLKSRAMDMERFKFSRFYWLVFFIIVALLGIAAGMIFYLRDVDKGLLVISHLMTLALGVLGGLGIKKLLAKPETKDSSKDD